mmetsp:Transcript_22664/g.51119  ORF Transcript_22664/g.51119 Transcript_22664/m.51119 type:complete len:97 (-) Transcript_22664:85-375(-)
MGAYSRGCTPASPSAPWRARKKYAMLPFQCYEDYYQNWQWQQMASNCDPQGLVDFVEPADDSPPTAFPEAATVESSGSAPVAALACIAGAALQVIV